ncbi:PadR family transcriptional regulator [Longispora fulva]|uniref:DNA-binding PadR family transcriptional regulator n=1 Tax=Longispora fulva TaxID=619741 RepID=A0A8J7GGG9_9ACTN|nr:PadR family transcriptional regulator [Longispora fulva]MBG6137185.1 DNA-binding PadR family transcriptional regulator [Longispora fulva]GIG61461.1 PadR family transcriptional regulator [Longispora fulva]
MTFRRSPLALAVLALLIEEPMHPYRMQQLIRQRHKDQVVNVGHRASLYKTIDRLLAADLITVEATTRDTARPERTVYAVTDAGTTAARTWMADMLAHPAAEFPDFPAAMSFLPLLTPAEAAGHLARRAEALAARLAQLTTELDEYGPVLPRVTLVESEYLRAVTAAELGWVTSLVTELRDGSLSWSLEELRAFAAQFRSTHP